MSGMTLKQRLATRKLLQTAIEAMAGVFGHLKATGSTVGAPMPRYDFTKLSRLMVFQDGWDFDRDHAE